MKKFSTISLTILRILIGWHFLYEGIAKLFNPNWSSTSYLMESEWLFSGLFHRMISNPVSLGIVDFLNIWALLIIGILLFIGLFTRIASLAGAFLLILYYIASPPFAYSSIPSTSHFYLINYNIIEAAILFVFVFLPKDYMWGLHRYIRYIHLKRKEEKFPSSDNHEILENYDTSRRELIKNLAVIPLLGGVFFGMAKKRGWISFEEKNLSEKTDAMSGASLLLGKNFSIKDLEGQVPAGKIKNIKLSRIMIGGNLISGFAHARDLIYVSTWLKQYFSDEKVIETLWICEACGINTAILRCDENTIRILEKYWKRGGKIQWLAQTYPQGDDFDNIQLAIDSGAIGAFIQGGIADKIVLENRLEHLFKPIEFIQNKGLIAGTAAHSLTVLEACANNGIKADFFMKTYHHHNYWSVTPVDPDNPYLPADGKDRNEAHDNIWCVSDIKTSEFFRNNQTPWIAYKVLAAGAIKPEDGFKFTFEGGADFACVGMFDFQVVENANIIYSLFNSDIKRERQWYA